MAVTSYVGARLFDGARFLDAPALVVEDGVLRGMGAPVGDVVHLPGGVLAPGFIDLQINGAGGIAVDGQTDVDRLRRICAAQARLGATGCLPTLITDTPQATRTVIEAGIAAARARAPGFLGLHLEGPHLSLARKGAHDPALIRPMEEPDLALLLAAAKALPSLMVTVAPENVRPEQIAALAEAGVIVSLGHTDCSAVEARKAIAAGARCATHLFNAMSQLGNREPGMVGAILGSPIACGLIADGVHVDPLTLRIALAAKAEGVFLVSDCMAIAGTEATEFRLGGRTILRRDGRLTLADGTLAGADLTLDRAIGVLVTQAGIAPARALAMATAIPATVLGRSDEIGHLAAGRAADFVHLSADWRLAGVWQGGARLA
jgi:N-acetylglucosamine-6-phosphate deacetylase